MALPGPVSIAVSCISPGVVSSSLLGSGGMCQFTLIKGTWPSLWKAPGYPEVTQVKTHTLWKNTSQTERGCPWSLCELPPEVAGGWVPSCFGCSHSFYERPRVVTAQETAGTRTPPALPLAR